VVRTHSQTSYWQCLVQQSLRLLVSVLNDVELGEAIHAPHREEMFVAAERGR
jgi:hypothetical protein